MSLQGWAVGVVLLVAGYAWHDALRGRFPGAGRWALAALLLVALVCAATNAPLEYGALGYAATLALGWSLRLPRKGEKRVPLLEDMGVALFAVLASVLVAATWSPGLVAWGFVVGASLVALRIAVVDPLLAWRSRRRGALPDAETAEGGSING